MLVARDATAYTAYCLPIYSFFIPHLPIGGFVAFWVGKTAFPKRFSVAASIHRLYRFWRIAAISGRGSISGLLAI